MIDHRTLRRIRQQVEMGGHGVVDENTIEVVVEAAAKIGAVKLNRYWTLDEG